MMNPPSFQYFCFYCLREIVSKDEAINRRACAKCQKVPVEDGQLHFLSLITHAINGWLLAYYAQFLIDSPLKERLLELDLNHV